MSASAQGDATPAPECPVYSLEGVRLGMTLDEAKAALPSWTWAQDAKDPLRWTAKQDAPVKAWLAVRLRDGKIWKVLREWAAGDASVTTEGVMSAFRQRYGTRSTGRPIRGSGIEHLISSATQWDDPPCGGSAWVETGTYLVHTRSMPTQKMRWLRAGVQDIAAVQANVEAAAAGVKF